MGHVVLLKLSKKSDISIFWFFFSSVSDWTFKQTHQAGQGGRCLPPSTSTSVPRAGGSGAGWGARGGREMIALLPANKATFSLLPSFISQLFTGERSSAGFLSSLCQDGKYAARGDVPVCLQTPESFQLAVRLLHQPPPVERAWVCVCVCGRERERERRGGIEAEINK